MKLGLLLITTTATMVFIYWCGGGDFERGIGLGCTVSFITLVNLVVAANYLADVESKELKRERATRTVRPHTQQIDVTKGGVGR